MAGNQYHRDSEEEIAERFLSYIKITDGCWEWQGACSSNGYGAFSPHHKTIGAHRAAYELFLGKIPAGLYVCHICNNKRCVRPLHLYVDTAKKNTEHAIRDGLLEGNNQGSKHGMAKLDEEKVVEIRNLYKETKLSHVKIAKMYGVSHRTIGRTIERKQWKHVEESI